MNQFRYVSLNDFNNEEMSVKHTSSLSTNTCIYINDLSSESEVSNGCPSNIYNGVSSNPVEGRTKIRQLKNLILTLFGLIFRRI